MAFQSYQYLFLFLPVVFACYLVVRRNHFMANTLIYLASFIFYGFSGWYFVFFLMFSVTMDFLLGKKIGSIADKQKRKKWLIISCTTNLTLLSIVKYSGWIVGDVAYVMDKMQIPNEHLHFTIPLVPGISFYTFHSLSYIFDIYRGEEKPRKSLTNYFTFVSFFPLLVAGPIERSRNLLPQLESVRGLISFETASIALFYIGWGIFKKLVFADNFGDIVNNVDLDENGTGLIFAYAFAFQVYCDFSAYTDIARGSAKLFNINLSDNFRTPYFSMNPSDFWRRWHISLSSWVRDYVFIPLGGSRGGRMMTARNLFITMFLCGLWHGAGFNFIIWGLYHGGLLVLYHYYPFDQKLTARYGGRIGTALSMFLLFNFVSLGWIFFRGESANEIWEAVRSIAMLFHFPGSYEPFLHASYVFILFAVPIVVTDYLGFRKGGEYPALYAAMPLWLKVSHYVIFFYGLVFLGKRLSSDFIYFQF